jgi:uncharacterized protein (UPF0548 family)
MRRSTYTATAVTYGSVGGTQAVDLMTYPPEGYRPAAASARLGSGDERFEQAVALLMTWGVQRGSGIEVTRIEQEVPDEPGYQGLEFDEDGVPQVPVARPREALYGDDGTPWITSGTSAVLRMPFGPFHPEAPVRVVYTIDEADRVGFAYGTVHGHPLSGEEAFLVSREPDGSVWLTLRVFSRPASWPLRLASPVLRIVQGVFMRRYLKSLHPAVASA